MNIVEKLEKIKQIIESSSKLSREARILTQEINESLPYQNQIKAIKDEIYGYKLDIYQDVSHQLAMDHAADLAHEEINQPLPFLLEQIIYENEEIHEDGDYDESDIVKKCKKLKMDLDLTNIIQEEV